MNDRTLLQQVDESFGTSIDDASLSGNDAPNGNNFAGAANHIQSMLETMDEMDVAYADLSNEKQAELDEYVEDFRYHIKKIANLGSDMVGKDDQFELPNGNTVDLPGAATSRSGNNTDLPADPRGQQ